MADIVRELSRDNIEPGSNE